MADYWPQTVAIPPTSSYGPTPTDFSWLSKLPEQYYQGQTDALALAQKNAFSGGVPMTPGTTNPDGTVNPPTINGAAMFNTLASKGAYTDAAAMQQAAMQQAAVNRSNQELDKLDNTSTQPGTAGSPVGASGASASASPSPGAAPNASPNYDGLNPFLIQNGQKENSGSFRIDTGNGGGLGQFIPGTWDMLHQMRPDLIPPTIAQATPEQQKAALILNQQINQHALATNGITINPRTERLTWVMGSKGGPDFIGAMRQMPGAPAAQLFPAEAHSNPTLFYNNGPDGKPNLNSPRPLSQVFVAITDGFGGGTSAPSSANQVAGPGAPSSSAKGPVAYAADGTPVQTDANGNAIGVAPVAPHAPTGAPAAVAPTAAASPNGTTGWSKAAEALTAPFKVIASLADSSGTPAAPAPAPVAPTSGLPTPTPAPVTPIAPPPVAPQPVRMAGAPTPTQPTGATTPGQPPPAQAQATGGNGPTPPQVPGVPAGVDPYVFVNRMYQTAAALAQNPYSKDTAAQLKDRADKIVGFLQSETTSRSPEIQEYLRSALPGESVPAWKARVAGAKKQAEMDVANANTIQEVQPTPGGPKQYDTTANILKRIQAGQASADAAAAASAPDRRPAAVAFRQICPSHLSRRSLRIARSRSPPMKTR
jgi:hypothetical protein